MLKFVSLAFLGRIIFQIERKTRGTEKINCPCLCRIKAIQDHSLSFQAHLISDSISNRSGSAGMVKIGQGNEIVLMNDRTTKMISDHKTVVEETSIPIERAITNVAYRWSIENSKHCIMSKITLLMTYFPLSSLKSSAMTSQKIECLVKHSNQFDLF